MKPKILFIMHMPPPVHGAAQIGQYIHDSKLINNSFECRYFNPSASANVKQVGHLSLSKIKFLFNSIFKINRIIKEWGPDLVYVTPSAWDWGFYRDFLTVSVLKRNGCKIIAHFHNRGVKEFEEKWYNKKLYRSFFNGIKTIFISKKLLPEFKNYLKEDQIYICPNGIASTLHTEIERTPSHNPFTFLFLSNMMEEKGVYILLEACKILNERGYSFKCDFIGKWADIQEQPFKEKVHTLSISHIVQFHGPKYDAEKHPFFEQSDCFVFPTYYHGETFGLVLLEAMEYSMPVIATDIAGIPDIVEDKKNGYCVKPRNAEDLANKMAAILDNPQKAIEMGLQGRKKFNTEFTLNKFESNIYSIFRDCLQCPKF